MGSENTWSENEGSLENAGSVENAGSMEFL